MPDHALVKVRVAVMMKEFLKVYLSYGRKQAIYAFFVMIGLFIAYLFGYATIYLFVMNTILLVACIAILIKFHKTGVIDNGGLLALKIITGTKFTIFMTWVGLIPVILGWISLLRFLLSQYGLF